MSLRSVVMVALVALCCVSCTGQQVEMDAGCVPGESAACTCDGGVRGAHTCSPSGSFGTCMCSAGDAAMDAQPLDVPNDMVGIDIPAVDTGDPCDLDGDNHRAASCGGDDCDDADPERFLGNTEFCSRPLRSGASSADHDEDCNPCTVFNPLVDGDGDEDHDGFPSHDCVNPWVTASRPATCNDMIVTVNDPVSGGRGTVSGADCNDDPAPVTTADGGVVVADGGDGGVSLTGRDIRPGQVEACNGIDDNCNGAIDEGVGDLFYRDCDGDLFGDSSDMGSRACSSERLTQCMGHDAVRDHTDCDDSVGTTHPGLMETCNGVDDDCNRVIDDAIPQIGTDCATGMMGPCAPGIYQCRGAAGGLVCQPNTAPVSEVCNGTDDDCDGVVDDGDPGDHAGCTTGLPGVCSAGTHHCVGGSIQCVQNTGAGSEVVCNGVDDDCNPGTPDAPSTACYTGPSGTQNVGICHGGTTMCSGSSLGCSGQQLPATEVCDGVDNDCNGALDVGCNYNTTRPNTDACGANVTETCRPASASACSWQNPVPRLGLFGSLYSSSAAGDYHNTGCSFYDSVIDGWTVRNRTYVSSPVCPNMISSPGETRLPPNVPMRARVFLQWNGCVRFNVRVMCSGNATPGSGTQCGASGEIVWCDSGSSSVDVNITTPGRPPGTCPEVRIWVDAIDIPSSQIWVTAFQLFY